MATVVVESTSEHRKLDSKLVVGGIVIALLAGLALGRMAGEQPDETTAVAAASSASNAAGADRENDVIRYKIPVTMSQPAKGSSAALVTLVEWCDLRNLECKRLTPVIDGLLTQYGDSLRIVFRHYLDVSRRDAGMVAEFSMVAHAQADKFWQARDLIAGDDRTLSIEDLENYAERLGMDRTAARTALLEHSHQGHIVTDSIFGAKFGVREVPTVFVNGRRLSGQPTRAAIEQLLDEELTLAKALVSQGVAASDVYAELTKDGLWGAENQTKKSSSGSAPGSHPDHL